MESWDEKTQLSNELDVLGFYVSAHPMRKYEKELKKYTSRVNTESIKNVKDRSTVTIAGVVRSLDVKHTKRGTGLLGNLILEDLEGHVEAVIFNDTLRKSLPLLEQKLEPIIVKGTVEKSEDNKIKIIVTDISSLHEFKLNSSIHIKINESVANKDNLENLKQIFEMFPGNSKVLIHLKTGISESLVEVGNCKVEVHDQFIQNVEKLLGDNAVSLS